jgi:hypothetical protein
MTERERRAAESYAAERELARGPSTLGDVWTSEWQRTGLDAVFGTGAPLSRAYEELRVGVESAAGGDIRGLAREKNLEREWLSAVGIEGRAKVLAQLVETLPDEAKADLKPLIDVRKRAVREAHKTESEAAEIYANSYGLSATAVSFLAGTTRQMADPAMVAANVLTAAIGGPFAGPVLRVIGRQAAAGAVAQAAVEPAIQAGRAELGLEAGFVPAAGNVLQSAIGAGGLAALFRGGAATIRLARSAREAPIDAPARPVVSEPAAAAPISEPIRPAEGPPIGEAELRPAAAAAVPEAPPIGGPALAPVRPVVEPEPRPAAPPPQPAPLPLFERTVEARAIAENTPPADLEAVANLVERDAVVDRVAPDPSPSGLVTHSERLEGAIAGIEEGRAPVADVVAPEDVVTVEVKKRKMGRAAAPEHKWSLLEFLASKGGLKHDADALQSFGGKNPLIPSFGPLFRKTGKTLDQAREMAVEAGYLVDVPEMEARARGGEQMRPSETTTNTLLDAIDAEARGAKQYRQGQQGLAIKEQAAEIEAYQFDRAIDNLVTETGLAAERIEPVRARVREIMTKEGESDIDTAFDRAVMEYVERDFATERRDVIGEIPGWDVPVEPAAIRDTGAEAGGTAPGVAGGAPEEGGRIGAAARGPGEVERAAAGAGERPLGTESLSAKPFPESEKVVLDTGRGEQFLIEGVAPAEATGLSPEYRDALAKHDAAQAAFAKVRDDYRAQKVGDAEFNAAAQAMKAADREFDAAFAKEQARPTGEPARGQAAMPAGGLFDPAATSQTDLLDAINSKVMPGDPVLLREAARVLDEAGGDLEITLQMPDGSTRTSSTRAMLREAAEDENAAQGLIDCIGTTEAEL